MNILSFYRKKPKGVADLLNYAGLIDDGIVLGKNGGLMAAYFFQGEDTASSTDERRNDVSRRVNRAFARLGNGVSTWVDAVRMPTDSYSAPEASHFADPLTRMLDDDRRRRFQRADQHFETEQVLFVQYLPPLKSASRFEQLLHGNGQAHSAKATRADGERHLADFKKMLRELEDALGDVLRMQRMGSFEVIDPQGRKHRRDQLVNYLNFAVTGNSVHLNLPPTNFYLDAIIGGQELHNGDFLKIGNKYVATVAVEGFPAYSWPGILQGLNNMAISYRAVFRFIHLDQQTSLGVLKKFTRRWKQAERGFVDQLMNNAKGAVNQDAVSMRLEVEDATTDAQSGLVSFGYATPVIVLMDNDLGVLTENAQRVAQYIDQMGFNTRVETINTMEAWLGSLPGHAEPNVRRPLTHTLAWADMLPLATVWPGEPHAPCPFYPPESPPLFQGSTSGATPFRGNLHVGDVGHTLIVGPTGAGKSVLLGFLAQNFRRYEKATITAFDKGGSMLALCLGAGGRHYDLTPGEPESPKLCPLQHIDNPADLGWAQDWLCQLYELSSNQSPTPAQRADIGNALRLMQADPLSRSLSHFCKTVQDRDVQQAIADYTMIGPLGTLLDAEQDGLADGDFSVFEIEEIMNMGEKNLIPVLLYIFRRFEKSLKGQPALLVLDEAWIMLGHPVFREKIREWLKVLRKRNCAVVLATQSLSDLQNSGIMDVLQESCPTRFFLPNDEAEKAGNGKVLGPRDLYAVFGLNERQIEIIANARKKRQYYFVSALGSRLISLDLEAVELAFIGISDHAQQNRVKALYREHGAAWPQVWLAELGIKHPPFRDPSTFITDREKYQNAA